MEDMGADSGSWEIAWIYITEIKWRVVLVDVSLKQ